MTTTTDTLVIAGLERRADPDMEHGWIPLEIRHRATGREFYVDIEVVAPTQTHVHLSEVVDGEDIERPSLTAATMGEGIALAVATVLRCVAEQPASATRVRELVAA